ncbi:uncharacterized protein ACN427_008543 isoform 1-T2 [Glossina fuscipes fuscipes]
MELKWFKLCHYHTSALFVLEINDRQFAGNFIIKSIFESDCMYKVFIGSGVYKPDQYKNSSLLLSIQPRFENFFEEIILKLNISEKLENPPTFYSLSTRLL